MKYIFFDTETTGLPKDSSASYTNIDNWPRLVQIAWIVYKDNEVFSKHNHIIRPVGFTIPEDASNIHGITTEIAVEQGLKVEVVLPQFLLDCQKADAIIGHNINFDLNVVQAEMHRLNLGNLKGYHILDTMKTSIDFCGIPDNYHGYRYPKLIELYSKLFSETFDDIHNAMADVEATAKCFWEMIKRNIINKEEHTFLLSETEKSELASEYIKQAIEIMWGTRNGSVKDARVLQLKAAKLGNTEGMYKTALDNMGGIFSSQTDYQTAKYWLEKIVELSKSQEVSWYRESLIGLIKIYKHYGDKNMVAKYQKLLDDEDKRKQEEMIELARNSEYHFNILVHSIFNGQNGFSKDKERAYALMKEGIENGNRLLYGMYSDYLRENGDERYFEYLIESIKDSEQHLKDEYSRMEAVHNTRTAKWMKSVHSDYWLTDRYRIVAEAYLTGFGVEKDLKQGELYLYKALKCNNKDVESTILLAKLYNGEFGSDYIDFEKSIRQIELLSLKNLEDDQKIAFALLGDAYIGISKSNYFKAMKYYNQYPKINSYNSHLRKRYSLISNIIIASICAIIVLFVVLLNILKYLSPNS